MQHLDIEARSSGTRIGSETSMGVFSREAVNEAMTLVEMVNGERVVRGEKGIKD